MQFHTKNGIYLISRVFLPGFSGPLCLIRSFPCCFIPKVNNRSHHSISVQLPIIMSGSRSFKFVSRKELLKNVLKFVRGITFEPAFFLYMLAHGFYVMASATMYIDKVRIRNMCQNCHRFRWKYNFEWWMELLLVGLKKLNKIPK